MQKFVSRSGGFVIKRPAQNHPHPAHWEQLRAERRSMQIFDGAVRCGTCWEAEGDVRLDLHHRHYSRFGCEQIEDVILLCASCHDGITNSIRSRRFALGDRSISVEADHSTDSAKRFRPSTARSQELLNMI